MNPRCCGEKTWNFWGAYIEDPGDVFEVVDVLVHVEVGAGGGEVGGLEFRGDVVQFGDSGSTIHRLIGAEGEAVVHEVGRNLRPHFVRDPGQPASGAVHHAPRAGGPRQHLARLVRPHDPVPSHPILPCRCHPRIDLYHFRPAHISGPHFLP